MLSGVEYLMIGFARMFLAKGLEFGFNLVKVIWRKNTKHPY